MASVSMYYLFAIYGISVTIEKSMVHIISVPNSTHLQEPPILCVSRKYASYDSSKWLA
jgi:hypothetical protein